MLDQFLTTTEAARVIPKCASRRSVSYWMRHGVQAKDGSGRRIRLRYVRRGQMLLTTPQWIEQFFQESADADGVGVQIQQNARGALKMVPVMNHAQADREMTEAGL